MIINHPSLMCTGVQPPREWEMNGQKGVTYKIELSDGSGNIAFPCDSGDTWKLFEPFKAYAVSIEMTQTSHDGRLGIRARVVGAAKVEAK